MWKVKVKVKSGSCSRRGISTFTFTSHFSLNGKWRPHRDLHTVCRIESPDSYSWKMRADEC